MRMKAKYQQDLENSKGKYWKRWDLFLFILFFIIFLGGGEIADELRKEIQALRHRVEQLETELEEKNNEIKNVMGHKHSDTSIVSYRILFLVFLI